jgi:endonuclease/exonuclease/phosphatase family metal-dependent hydrolase
MNDLIIRGTLFTHRYIHKLTWNSPNGRDGNQIWNSPNGRDRNQIDHLMINSVWRHSLLDFKVNQSADVGSDHHLVTAYIKFKLKKTEVTNKHDLTHKD